jgi:hypothetical protein
MAVPRLCLQTRVPLDVPTKMRTRLSAFLDSHLGGTYRDDVGPLFGQASAIRDHVFADETSRRWHEAVNAAVSSEASREVSAKRRSRQRSAGRPR